MCMLQFINLNVTCCYILLAVLSICCDIDKESNHTACKDRYFVITVLCLVHNIHCMDFTLCARLQAASIFSSIQQITICKCT